MKNIIIAMWLMAVIPVAAQNQEKPLDYVELNTEIDSLSYFLGISLGYELHKLPFEADPDLIFLGFVSAFEGTTNYDDNTAQQIFRELQMSIQRKEQEQAQVEAEERLARGNQYLEENGQREGVISTESGLQYQVVVQGDGPMPADTSQVRVHYEGTLIDGTVFDSSYERGEPITFPLNQVIPGWTEGVQLMPVGSTYNLYIPANLAYGARDNGTIPANSVLVFKIELLGIE
jgi:FKBP-type peptidyl-prolyl cis-trans isomerase FkpA